MTEAEWLKCKDPRLMLTKIGVGPASERKRRLFAVGCCRRVWEHFSIDPLREVMEAHEAYADHLIDESALYVAIACAEAAREPGRLAEVAGRGVLSNTLIGPPWRPAEILRSSSVTTWVSEVVHRMNDCQHSPDQSARAYPDNFDGGRRLRSLVFQALRDSEESTLRRSQSDLLREIFGNPFQPPAIDPVWLTWNGGTVPGLALSIYMEKAFDRLPILADALEEAGCADAALLSHCRGESDHVRGCWALDALLGRR